MAQAGPIRTFADLRLHAITTWVQPISICFPTAIGGHHEVLLCVRPDKQPLPMPLFENELVRLFKEGTASGGRNRKWWLRQSTSPVGTLRLARFDRSVLFVCPHYRKEYKKQETAGNRNSQHISCVECPAMCRMKGSVVKTDPSVCLIISGKLEHCAFSPNRNILACCDMPRYPKQAAFWFCAHAVGPFAT